MIKYERNGDFCILIYTAAATYIVMDLILPHFEIQFMKDGTLELSFKTETARNAVYDTVNERLC